MAYEVFKLAILRSLLGLFLFFCIAISAFAESPAIRIKELAHVLEARDNQLIGFGLVVGLKNSGDKTQTGFTQQALTNLISRMGVVPQNVDYKSRNVAAVMVTATLPPFVKSGQKIDVTVSSMGDATSLQGGTLLLTPLRGIDDKTYAVAQGSLIIGVDPSQPTVPYVRQRQTTVGRIPSGALVEKDIQVSLGDKGVLTIVLDEPDFTTATRVSYTIQRNGFDASAKDAGTISIPLAGGEDLVALISKIENLKVVPDVVAKIVVNERTGTIVIGENVKISPVAVSYAGIDVIVGNVNMYSETTGSEDNPEDVHNRAYSSANVKRSQSNFKVVPSVATLSNLVNALNKIGASPKDMIAILQAMKKAGAIKAELEVI